MRTSVLIVVALRIIVPIRILRRPLPWALISAALDAGDVILVDAIARGRGEPRGFGSEYARIDKWLDTYYLAVEVAESTGWPETLARRTGLALFAHRLIGVTLFERTRDHRMLFLFPNVFENFYWFVLIARRVAPDRIPRGIGAMVGLVAVLSLPKLAQEWVLHGREGHPWQWLRTRVVVPAVRRLGRSVPEDALDRSAV